MRRFLKYRDKSFLIWLASGCVLIFVMILIGGLTRLTHSGLSMVDWTLFGSTPPFNQSDWEHLFEQYKQYPEYKQVNFNFSLEDFKKIFWWEYIHRMIGRLMGLIFIAGWIYFSMKKIILPPLHKRLLILGLLGFSQGLLGWYMVQSGLLDRPDVSHYRLAMHLGTAFITFAYNLWLLLSIGFEEKLEINHQRNPGIGKWLVVFNVLLFLQIIYGAFVAGLDAGFVFNDWPLMDNSRGQWMADAVTAMQPFWKNWVENIAGVQFIHRHIPYLLFVIWTIVWLKSRKQLLSKSQTNSIRWIGLALLLQFILGVTTLLMHTPLLLASLHQLGGFILWAMGIFALHRFFTK